MANPAAAQEQLGSFNIDPNKVSISGISSGAFMANQFHIAHSELIMGAGLVAGGLYTCAVWRVDENSKQLDATISRALDRCMFAKAPLESVETYTQRVEAFAEAAWIDPLSALGGDKVYLFTGRADNVVNPATVERAAEVYRALGVKEDDLRFQKFLDQPSPDTGAGHSWVTDDCCQPCEANQSPFINDCGYDQAEEILEHIYGDLRPKTETLSGTLVEFSQSEFVPDGKAVVNGLNDTGLVYVPTACAEGGTCSLHVVLHGCEQSTEVLGDTFYKKIGVNEWADSNGIVILYPQATSVDRATLDSAFPDRIFRNSFAVNPNGCWNWWGYAYDERFALKDGIQIGAIHGMIKRIMGTDAE
jgi:poly(3-hydroxybutyrate) depolymerase